MTGEVALVSGGARGWLRRFWVLLSFVPVLLALGNVLRMATAGARIAGWDLALLVVLATGIAVGSAMPIRIGYAKSVTPLATATAVALAFASCRPSESPIAYTASAAILSAGIGYTAGILMRCLLGQAPRQPIMAAAPMVTVAAMAILYRALPIWGGHTGVQLFEQVGAQRWKAVIVMAVIAGAALLVELFLVGFLVRPVRDLWSFVAETLKVLGPIHVAAATTGIAIAIGLEVLSLWAVPLIAMPLLLAREAMSRTFDGQHERRQSIAALSTMTDVAGYTRVGHSARVAAMSQKVGQELNLSDRELTVLTEAALLHDIGQVSLTEPIPDGATVEAAPLDQLSIAAEGGAILRRSGVLDEVAKIVEAQAVQYRQVREFGEEVPTAARIIKVCNALDDLTKGEMSRVDAALERLSIGLGYEYDPAVVTALQRIHARPKHAYGRPARISTTQR